ncbi:MAG: adenosine deaminase [Clostridium sp.]|nr:adenosine deaminase [Clostridium sp.]MCM1172680.1 adenosine deaminase [Clostridium sp.]MCM1209014.1 adenosine deaminase [Ruminococcus sp.]
MTKNKMPRVELHCHLDGSLSKGCIEELLGRPVEDEELGVSVDCRDLAQYLEKFDLPLSVLQSEAGLKRAGYDFMKTMHHERMDYVEVRFAPLLSTQKGLAVDQIIASVIDGLEKGKMEYGVEYGVIVCAMRHHSHEENLAMIKASREFLGNGVCGADLAGNEAAYPMSEFMELFREVHRLGMPFTIHAGECGNVKNITDAIACGATRIGHGIAMRTDEAVMKLCADRRIGVELCPISNLQTKAVKDMSEYPMKQFLDNHILVTVNTDNRTVSTTTMDKELDFIQKNYGITDDEIICMMKNAVEVSWADETIKDKLMKLF